MIAVRGARIAWPALLAAAVLVAGCAGGPRPKPAASGGYYQNDGPPDNENIDLAAIGNAVPRDEPLSRFGNPSSYAALGRTYRVLDSASGFVQTGRASWYGRQFDGKRTSSGEIYDMFKMTAAHKRLPIPSYVRVTNLANHKQVIVRVNDRGPFRAGRIIDLSYVAARKLGVVAHGSAPVRIETVTPASLRAERGESAPRRSAALARAGEPDSPTTGHSFSDSFSDSTSDGSAASAPARPVKVSMPAPQTPRTGRLYLQSGAFAEREHAATLRARLDAAGFDDVVIVSPSRQTPLYRVRVGPFTNTRGRNLAQRRLASHGFATRDVRR